MAINIALIDIDQVVRAQVLLSRSAEADGFGKFFRRVKDELLPGQTAHLEIDDAGSHFVSLEITRSG